MRPPQHTTTSDGSQLSADVRKFLEALSDMNGSTLRPAHAHKDAESRAKAARRIATRAAALLRGHIKEGGVA